MQRSRIQALSIAGHDPTGGAGTTADITTFASLGIHAATVITANTVQTSARCLRWEPVDTALIDQQLSSLLAHARFDVVKIGMIGSAKTAQTLKKHLSRVSSDIPIVLDPVLASEEHDSLSERSLPTVIAEELLPLCTLVTPNTREFDSLKRSALQWQQSSEWTLVTGTHEAHDQPYVQHKLFHKAEKNPRLLQSKRLPSTFHGSGCTLASAISGFLAHKHSVPDAVAKALKWTHDSLLKAYPIDSTKVAIPNRLGVRLTDRMDQPAQTHQP